MNAPERITLETRKLLQQVISGNITAKTGEDRLGHYMTVTREYNATHIATTRLNVLTHEDADRKINTEVRKAATTITAIFLKATFLDNKDDASGRDPIYSLPDTQQQANGSLSRYSIGEGGLK